MSGRLRAEVWQTLREAEAQRQARELADRGAVEARIAANATRQTRQKLRRNVVGTLLEDGRLIAVQVDAADEIMQCWSAVTRGLFARCMRYDRTPHGLPADDWRPSLSRAWTERYCPWRDDALTTELLRPGWTRASLCLEVVVDNHGIRQVADRHGMDQRTVLRELQRGLHRYAELAGWLQAHQPAMRVAEIATFA